MVRASKVIVVVAALVAACHLRSHVFVAPPNRKAVAVASATGVMACLASAAPAFADKIDEAALKLAAVSYPFLKEVPWTATTYATLPEVKDPLEVLKIIDKCLILGAAMDPIALRAGALAHSRAISSIDANGVTSQQDYAATIGAIGHMIASAGTPFRHSTLPQDIYNLGLELLPANSAVPAYLMGTVNSQDAVAAYNEFLEFTNVVARASFMTEFNRV